MNLLDQAFEETGKYRLNRGSLSTLCNAKRANLKIKSTAEPGCIVGGGSDSVLGEEGDLIAELNVSTAFYAAGSSYGKSLSVSTVARYVDNPIAGERPEDLLVEIDSQNNLKLVPQRFFLDSLRAVSALARPNNLISFALTPQLEEVWVDFNDGNLCAFQNYLAYIELTALSTRSDRETNRIVEVNGRVIYSVPVGFAQVKLTREDEQLTGTQNFNLAEMGATIE